MALFELPTAAAQRPTWGVAALLLAAERNHVIAEGAGACPVACAIAGRAGGGKVVCIVSGGNIDLDEVASLVATYGKRAES